MAALRAAMAALSTTKMAARGAPRDMGRSFSTSSPNIFTPPPSIGAVGGDGGTPGREQAPPSTNLFVSGLNKRTTTDKLREAFAQFGRVLDARVVTDRVSGYSKGFGFVRYATIEEAEKGRSEMDGKFLDGWVIFAEYARPRPEHPRPQNNFNNSYGGHQ